MDQTAQNLQQQIELYGEPLGETVRRVLGPLGLTQGGLAQVIGLSAPMLSQLVSAQRVKIGNPAVMSRLRAASELADLVIASEIPDFDIPPALDRIRATTGALTTSGPTSHLSRSAEAVPHPGGQPTSPAVPSPAAPAAPAVPTGAPPSARAVVREIQDLFRAVASADEIQRAAAAVDSPALAELLLVYGTGRTADALAHYETHHG